MAANKSSDQIWHEAMSFWLSLWQRQFEQSMALWGVWAQMLPHEHASELSADAEAMKKPAPARRARTTAA